MSSTLSLRSLSASATRLARSPVSGARRQFHITPPRAALYPKADLKTFDAQVLNSQDRLVLVDFYADWCGPCHLIAPVLESLTREPNTSGSGLPMDLVKVNTEDDEGMELGAKYNVRALPTVIAFKDGEPVDQFVGALNQEAIRNFLQRF